MSKETEAMLTSKKLMIGDIVTFQSVQWIDNTEESYLFSEGILQGDLRLSSPDCLDDCKFAIHLQRQYSAARELKEFQDSEKVEDEDPMIAAKYLQALNRGYNNEVQLNNDYMQKKFGKPVLFGDIIQLYHVKSGKYVKIVPGELAKVERENIKIVMCETGDPYSWLQILPRFKIDRITDPIPHGTELYLGLAERPSEYIHVADRDSLPGERREVNCSLEATSWKLNIFQTAADTIDNKKLLASEIVYVYDPETKCYLMLQSPPLENLDDNIESNEDEKDEKEIDDEPEYKIILEPSLGTLVDSSALWIVELDNSLQGGQINYKTEKIKLKHFNTGKFIAIDLSLEELDEGGMQDRYDIIAIDDPEFEGNRLTMMEMNSNSNFLNLGKAVQISRNGLYLERGELVDKTYSIICGNDSSAAINFVINRYEETATSHNHDAIEHIKDPYDILTTATCRFYINQYYKMIELPKNDSTPTIWPKADRNDIEFFQFISVKIANFIEGFPIRADNVDLTNDKGDEAKRVLRQSLVRERGLLEVCLKIVNKLISITEKVENAEKLGQKFSSFSEDEQQMIRMSNDILQRILQIIYSAIKNNPRNQMYVADHMPVLLAHLGGQSLAGSCVTEMLGNNMELQETKITEREINIFVDKLRTTKMNAMYLRLLQSCCSCQGNGVDDNQCKVADALFSNTTDIIIQIHADYGKLINGDWPKGTLYIPARPVAGSPIRGDRLLIQGLPTLAIAWTTNSIDYSPLGLFGKLSVKVEDLFGANGNIDGFSNGKKKDKNVQVKAVADYFVAQLYLCAEMCMDRNYVGMGKVDTLFSYETLVTMLKLDITDSIKAAAIKVLIDLIVDRDPQAETKIPCLTRTWTDIESTSGQHPQLPYVEPNRRFIFALLQQIVADHIKSMKGSRWTDLALFMLKLLNRLARFNFYGTDERLQDVISGLILALDRRKIDAAVPEKKRRQSTRSVRQADETSVKKTESDISLKYSINDGGDDIKTTTEGASAAVTEGEELPEIWQEQLLSAMETTTWMLIVLAVVLVAVAVTIYESIAENVSTSEQYGLFVWEVLVFLLFLLELTTRAYCYKISRGTIIDFFKNVFNQIDFFVIAVDIVFLSLPAESGDSSSQYSKVARLVRLIRLLRVLRAARVVSTIAEQLKGEVILWELPKRYSKAPLAELQSMEEAVDILLFSQSVIEDRNISLFLKYFYLWYEGKDTRSPAQIFETVIIETDQLSLGSDDFDLIFIDVLMYVHKPLVQGSLDLLMERHSTRKKLIKNASQVQLLASPRRERQFKIVDQMLQQLERNAETHELWGVLETDEHHAINKQTHDILNELVDLFRIRKVVLDDDGVLFSTDKDIQDLYRNLGCFNIVMKVLGLLDSVEEDEETGEMDEVSANTHKLCVETNELLYWFFLDNPLNQEIGYEELTFFFDSLDKGIFSDRVIRALFSGNERLMLLLPNDYMSVMADLICKNGKKPYYLALYLSITYVGEKNIVENQIQIMKCIASPTRLPKIGCFLVPITHPSYEEKKELMAPFLNKKNVSIYDLPELLAYHLTLIDAMAGCTIGALNITSVEAKVQSVFFYGDVIDSILDAGTIILAKTIQSKFLFNAVIEVEMMVVGLEYSNAIWKLLLSYLATFNETIPEIENGVKFGIFSPDVNCQQLEYMIICIKIVNGFFKRYYDLKTFRIDESDTSKKFDLTQQGINNLIQDLYKSILRMYKMNANIFSEDHMELMYITLGTLCKSVSPVICKDIESIKVSKAKVFKEPDMEAIEEHAIVEKYEQFLSAIKTDPDVQKKTDREDFTFVSVLEQLPFISDNVISDLRYESLIKKIVVHVRDNLENIDDEKRMSSRCTVTTIWLLKAFRMMIENKMGMTIYERDEGGGAEQDEAAAPVVNALNSCGATALAIELIAVGIDDSVVMECIKLMIGMLYKEGGALEVQELIYRYINETDSYLFFKKIKEMIQNMIEHHKWNGIVVLPNDQDPELPDTFLIIRFLQLITEGHYRNNQNIVREQPNNPLSVNLLDDLVDYLNTLSRIPCRTSAVAAIRVSATILEVIQGPCVGNQMHLTLNTEILESLNRLLRTVGGSDGKVDENLEVRGTCIDIFQGLLEGQNLKSVIYERVLSVIHLDIIQSLAKVGEETEEKHVEETEQQKEEQPADDLDEEMADLQTNCMVLLQMLCAYKPSLRGEIGLSSNIADIAKTGVSSIEVFWNGELQRRFFNVPKLCADLSKASKDKLVEDVDRSSGENKLVDFLNRSYELYREMKLQQDLRALNLGFIFTRNNLGRVSWLNFFLALVIQFILIAYYEVPVSEDGTVSDTAVLPNNIENVVDALCILQISLSVVVLVMYCVLHIPIKVQSGLETGSTTKEITIDVISDFVIWYYLWYLSFTVAGYVYPGYMFFPPLLLDIIMKNSIARNVLRSITDRGLQLFLTFLLFVFVAYIYAFMLFFNFQDDFQTMSFNGYAREDCVSLWKCLIATLIYGISGPGGIGDYANHTVGKRYLLDLTWWIIAIIGVLNLIFGIIIMTFSSLRKEKNVKLFDTENICFICGLEKSLFDKKSDTGDGFKVHVKYEHHMWNYLYFFIYLWEQDKDDDDGLEWFVRRQIEKGKVNWFPMNKALSMEVETTTEEKFRHEIKSSLGTIDNTISGKVSGLQVELAVLLEQLAQLLKPQTDGSGEKTFAFFARKAQSSRMGRTPGGSVTEAEKSVTKSNKQISICLQRRRLYLDVISIKNVNIASEELHNVGCHIMTDAHGIISVHAHDVREGIVFFPIGEHDQHNLICDDAESGDNREIRLQVTHGKGNHKNNSVRTSMKDVTFIAFVDVSIAELFQADGLYIEKLCFVDEASSDISITIHISSEVIDEEM